MGLGFDLSVLDFGFSGFGIREEDQPAEVVDAVLPAVAARLGVHPHIPVKRESSSNLSRRTVNLGRPERARNEGSMGLGFRTSRSG